MKSQRPYLLRALYDWIVDSDEVPYVLVDATGEGVEVPIDHVQDGQIVLNMGPNAVRDLHIGDDYVMFGSRFDGRHFDIVLPMPSVRAIYCKDSGEGMVFPEETLNQSQSDEQPQPIDRKDSKVDSVQEASKDGSKRDGKGPTLRLV